MTIEQNIAKFHETVAILVKAYLDGTLVHGNCAACAVGNIVSANKGYKILVSGCGIPYDWRARNGRDVMPEWDNVFVSDGGDSIDRQQTILPENYKYTAKKQIDATGYTWRELASIERAFESVRADFSGVHHADEQYEGLMKVLDVLAEIHGIPLEQKENSKLLFVKP